MPLQATSGAASYDAFGGGVAAVPNYIEDVFSTYLYTGNGSTQTITNGIDLSGKGGLVWLKRRDNISSQILVDSQRGISKFLRTNTTDAESTSTTNITAFNTDGFSLGAATNVNGGTYASWTFRKQPKFFDVVTYTGNATAGRTIAHNLGSVPGCIIVKRLNGADNWTVYHRAIDSTSPENYIIYLNTTEARSDQDLWADTAPTSSVFSVGDNIKVNGSSSNTYVAYLFAHNAGGFGLTGTDNVISCGSFTAPSSGSVSVSLGYEPQWVMIKSASDASSWYMFDTMRGWTASGDGPYLAANSSGAEVSASGWLPINATGFTMPSGIFSSGENIIYIAIRRGPMKTPTTGTSVFAPVKQAGGGTVTTNFPVDAVFNGFTALTVDKLLRSRLQGGYQQLATSSTAAETTEAGQFDFASNTSIVDQYFGSGNQVFYECFKRAPSYFDEVCYSGSGVVRTVSHNLGVPPELMMIKVRSPSGYAWRVYAAPLGNTKSLVLNTTNSEEVDLYWNNTTPTSTVFTVNDYGQVNNSGSPIVAYLFASAPGVSKVGSYTGTGTTQTIDCGFTAGSRFVLIKRTDDSGDWYVWDSARGIVSGNDPYLLLNSTAAEVTNTDYVDTYSAGFEISSTAPAAINANGGTFIFLAIA